jgi:hypothetical protein
LLHGIAVLALHHQAAIVAQGNDHHRARVNHKLTRGSVTIGQTHSVAKGMQEVAFEQLNVLKGVLDQVVIRGGFRCHHEKSQLESWLLVCVQRLAAQG